MPMKTRSRANRLEIWRITEEGIKFLHAKTVFGTIAMLERLQPKDSDTDLLFVGTDRLQYFNVSWNRETNQMDTVEETFQDDAEPFMRSSQSQNKCLSDPTGKFMAMHLWEGVLNVFRLRTRKNDRMKLEVLAQVRLTELWMKTSTFIHSRTGHPKIAFLYKSRPDREEARVAIYRLTKDDKGADVSKFDPQRDRELDEEIADPYASMLIPVPVYEEKRYHVRNNEGTKAHLGGLLVVGETLLTYYDSLTYSTVSSAMQDARIYVAWAEYDGTHYLLADDYGRLDLLTIQTAVEPTGVVVTGMKIGPMNFPKGGTLPSRASQLLYMGHDTLFLASHHGDSQVIRIDISSNTAAVLENITNNAPIMDFAVMDMGNRDGDSLTGNAFSSGQARVVAGCGAYRDGTLRSIRSGVGLEDAGILDEIEGTRGLFTLPSYGSKLVDTLIVSLLEETRVFKFDADGGIEEIYEFQGMTLDAETLHARSLPSGPFLQVTSQTVRLIDPESGVTVSTWTTPEQKSIITVSANDNWALLSVDGNMLFSLNLLDNLAVQSQQTEASNDLSDQMSCLHAGQHPQNLGIVGWWASGTISVVDLATLKPLHGESLRNTEDSASVPRDVALARLHPESDDSTLLIATEDGNVITYNLAASDGALSGRKTVTLGNSPARLHILPLPNDTASIFATTEHASLIYSSEGRIIYSATTAEDATFVASFNAEAFPNSIVVSTNKEVRICSIDKERLTHVKALCVHETVRRLAYSPKLKAFGLGCIKKELIANEEVITSTFRLVDEIVFEELGDPFVLQASTGLELVESVIRAELPDSNGNLAERFIVGTSFMPDEVETGPVDKMRGRIIVLGVDKDRQVYQIASRTLKGHCRCLRMMEGHIVAGLSKTIVVYNYNEDTSTSGFLEVVASYKPASMPVDIDVSGNIIGVADLMQSLTLIEFTAPKNQEPARLVELARHQQPAWSTSVCHLQDERWLEADAQGNLVVLQRNPEAPTKQDRMRLEATSELNIGEQINRIRKLHVSSNENSVVSPKAILGSVSRLCWRCIWLMTDNSYR
jgi:DNA damage-binding protein 1